MSLYRSSNKPRIAKEIHDRFVAPFLFYMRQQAWIHSDLGKYLDMFFHAEDRRIYDAIAHVNFRMPGKYVTHGCHAIEGYGPRYIKAGTHLVLRRDRTIARVDIEVVQDTKRPTQVTSHVFYLTQAEYKNILDKIEFGKVKYG